jgi:hypothetical protein
MHLPVVSLYKPSHGCWITIEPNIHIYAEARTHFSFAVCHYQAMATTPRAAICFHVKYGENPALTEAGGFAEESLLRGNNHS